MEQDKSDHKVLEARPTAPQDFHPWFPVAGATQEPAQLRNPAHRLLQRPWIRRLVTRLIAIIPAVIVTALYGERGTGELLILSQVILSLQLSFAVVPLVQFTSERSKMGVFTNSRRLKIAAWSVTLLIISFNIYLLIQTFTG